MNTYFNFEFMNHMNTQLKLIPSYVGFVDHTLWFLGIISTSLLWDHFWWVGGTTRVACYHIHASHMKGKELIIHCILTLSPQNNYIFIRDKRNKKNVIGYWKLYISENYICANPLRC